MKLNLGCGYNKLEGWLNVDRFDACAPDLVCDLEQTPWPFEDSSVDEVLLNHALEHLGADSDRFLAIIQELYRVCHGGATVRINVPHPRHDDFMNDPTHVRIVTPALMALFSKRQNQIWRDEGASNSLLAFYLDVDFELRDTEMPLDVRHSEAFASGRLTEAQLFEMARSQNNVIREYRMTLEVVKG